MYDLTLTYYDRQAIDWVGHRYWNGDALYLLLRRCDWQPTVEWEDSVDITFYIPEHIAWQIRDLAEEGASDGSSPFPCFDPELCEKLQTFLDQIV